MDILGLDIVTVSLLVAISGTILHQVRSYNGKPLPKILDGIMVSVGGSFIAAHTVLSEISTSDPQLQVLTAIGLVAGTVPMGIAGQKVVTKVKGIVKSKKENPTVITKKFSMVPDLGPVGSHYQTNFVKDEIKGNIIPITQNYLWIKRPGTRSYIAVILRDSNENVIQIDQSHELDEDNNVETTRLELFAKDGKHLAPGKYSIQHKADAGTSYSTGVKRDEFEIV